MDDPVFEIEPAIVEAASQTTPSQEEHYEGSSPTLSATNVGKCRSRSRRPPGRPHDRRPRLFAGRAEAPCRRDGLCAAFPAITAIGKGYDAYVAVDASGTFSDTKREAGLLRMQQAGVIVSDYATLMVEILKDNARPEAAAVYGALDMPWATLVGQISKAYGKQSAAAPMNLR